jgi:PII-like signaling protein
MLIPREGTLLRIFLGEKDRHGSEALYDWIVRTAKERGLGGATVLRGIEGFGANSHLHTATILRLSTDLPIVVEIVDAAEKIEALVEEIGDAIGGGMITMEKVQVRVYQAERRKTPRDEG